MKPNKFSTLLAAACFWIATTVLLVPTTGISGVGPCDFVAQSATLAASDGNSFNTFGSAVAIDGDTAVVGAPWADIFLPDGTLVAVDSGSAYVYARSGNTWIQQAKLVASDEAGSRNFGYSVAISGDTIVVGAREPFGSGPGSAYVFVRSEGAWSQQAKLTASDGAIDEQFGWSVAFSGDTAVIGAHQAAPGGAGATYVFLRTGGAWSQQAKLTGSDSAAGDAFGSSVALVGNTAMIGAPKNDQSGSDAGAAYVFTRSGTVWSQQAKLSGSDTAAADQFGNAVAVSGETALIGAHRHNPAGLADAGGAYVFTRSGTAWSQQAKLTAADAATDRKFGSSVALDGDRALIGSYYAEPAGAAYAFTRSGVSWTQQAVLFGFGAAADAGYYYTVGVSGGRIVTGALGSNRGDPYRPVAGLAFIFDSCAGSLGVCQPANLVVNTDPGQCSAVVSFPDITNVGSCPGITVTCVPASGSSFPLGTTTVTCTAIDPAFHEVTRNFTVTVQDAEAPVIALLGANPITINAGSTFTDPGATASDICNSNLTGGIVVTGVVNINAIGTYTRTYSVSDAAGHLVSTTRTVNVVGVPVSPGTAVEVSTITDPGASVVLNGGTLQNNGGPAVLPNPVVISSNSTIAGAPVTLSGAITLANDIKLMVETDTTVTAPIHESGAPRTLTKEGPAALKLTAPSTHSGGVVHKMGKLQVAHDQALGTGPVRLQGGKLEATDGPRMVNNEHTIEADTEIEGTDLTIMGKTKLMGANRALTVKNMTKLDGGIEEDGTPRVLAKKGEGTLHLAAESKHSGGTSHEEGKLKISHDKALGTGPVALKGGKVEAAERPVRLSNDHHIEADTEIDGTELIIAGKAKLMAADRALVVKNQTRLEGSIEEDGAARALTKKGAGKLELAAENKHSGGTKQEEGSLQIGHDKALGTGAIQLLGGKLEATRGPRTVANDHHVEAETEISGETLEITGKTKLKVANAKLKVENATKLSAPVEDDGGSRALTKTGAGTLELAAKNTHSGGTHLEAGKAKISHDDAYGTGAVMLKGAKVEAAAGPRKVPNEHHVEADTEILGDALEITGKTKLKTPNAKIKVENTTKLSAPVEDDGGSRALTKAGAGTLELAAKNTHSGGTHLEAGKVKISHDDAYGTAAVMLEGAAVEAAAAARKVANEHHLEADTEISGEALEITGRTKLKAANAKLKVENVTKLSAAVEDDGVSRAVTKAGAGTLELAAKNTHSGGTHLEAGKAKISHDEAFGTGPVMLKGAAVEAAAAARKVANEHHLEADTEILGEALEITGKTKLKTPNAKLKVENTTKLSAAIEDDGTPRAVTKAGAGTLELAAKNTHSGGTHLEAGRAKISHDEAFGTGPVLLKGAKVEAAVAPRKVANEHHLEADTEILGEALEIAGKTTLKAPNAKLKVENTTKISAAVEDDGVPRAMTKAGAGTLHLAVENKHSGGTHQEEGTLKISHDKALGTGPVHLKGGKFEAADGPRTLDNEHRIEGNTEIEGTDMTLKGKTTLTTSPVLTIKNNIKMEAGIEESGGPQALTKKGTGTLQIAAESKHTGGVKHEQGTLQVGHDKALGTGPMELKGGVLEGMNGARELPNPQIVHADTQIKGTEITMKAKATLKANAALTVENKLKLEGGIDEDATPRELSKKGPGTLELAAESKHQGGIKHQEGEIVIAHDKALGPAPTVLDGGKLKVSGPRSITNDLVLEKDAEISGDKLQAKKLAVPAKPAPSQGPPPPAPKVVTKTPVEVDEIRAKPLPEHPQAPPPPLKKAGPAKMEVKGVNELPTEVEEGELKLASAAKAKAVTAKPAPKPPVPPLVPPAPPKVSGKGTAQKVDAAKGGKVKPGNSPGTLTVEEDLSFEGDGGPEPEPAIYEWDINNAEGTEGDDPGWAILSVGGSMQILATATNPIVLELVTLTLANEPGPMVNFDNQKCYSWPIVRATNGIIGFTPGAITVDTIRFTNAIDGSFSLNVENDGKDLVLHYSANHPVISLALQGLETMTVECHSPFVDPGATASNICSGDLTSRIVTTGSANVNQPGTYLLTYTVSDAQSSASANRTVNVVDTTRPTLAAPASFLHTTTNQTGANVTIPVVVTDLCDAAPIITCVPPSGSFFPPGETVVVCTAQDASGHTSEPVSVTVTVNRAPIARPLGAATTVGAAVSIAKVKFLGTGTDADGDALALVVPSHSTNGGLVTMNATHITYSPPPGFIGTDGFSYELSDGRGGIATGYFEVLVVSGNLLSQNQVSLTLTPSGATLRYAGIPGHTYQIQRTTDFVQWATIASLTAPPHGILEFTDITTLPVAAYRTEAAQ